MKIGKVIQFGIPVMLLAANAFAMTSGSPVDGSVTTFTTFVQGPVAWILIAAGIVGVGYHILSGREFGLAFMASVGAVIAGAMLANIQTMITYLIPGATLLVHMVR